MKSYLAISTAVALAASTFSVPQIALAQSARDYGSGDICQAERAKKANQGTVAGGVIGALVGSQVAGKGAKTEGAVLGAVVGGLAGRQIAKNTVKCDAYPQRVTQNSYQRANCRWVQEYYGGRNHSFEVCRNKDGVWRPSGRA